MAGTVQVSLALDLRPQLPQAANVTRQAFLDNVARVKEHIQAGDIFQLVLSQRFERRTFADPFEIYRSIPPSQSFLCSLHALSPRDSIQCASVILDLRLPAWSPELFVAALLLKLVYSILRQTWSLTWCTHEVM